MDDNELCSCCGEYEAQPDGICKTCWIEKCVDDYDD